MREDVPERDIVDGVDVGFLRNSINNNINFLREPGSKIGLNFDLSTFLSQFMENVGEDDLTGIPEFGKNLVFLRKRTCESVDYSIEIDNHSRREDLAALCVGKGIGSENGEILVNSDYGNQGIGILVRNGRIYVKHVLY
jgi:hypothetical protein